MQLKVDNFKRGHGNDSFLGECTFMYGSEYGMQQACIMQQAVGHCCGATFIATLNHYFFGKEENVKAFLEFLSEKKKKWEKLGHNAWIVQGFYMYLSNETAGFDHYLRQAGTKVHSFVNRSVPPGDHSSVVELWYVQL